MGRMIPQTVRLDPDSDLYCFRTNVQEYHGVVAFIVAIVHKWRLQTGRNITHIVMSTHNIERYIQECKPSYTFVAPLTFWEKVKNFVLRRKPYSPTDLLLVLPVGTIPVTMNEYLAREEIWFIGRRSALKPQNISEVYPYGEMKGGKG